MNIHPRISPCLSFHSTQPSYSFFRCRLPGGASLSCSAPAAASC